MNISILMYTDPKKETQKKPYYCKKKNNNKLLFIPQYKACIRKKLWTNTHRKSFTATKK